VKQKAVAAALAAGLVLGSAALMKFLGRWEGEGQNIVYADKLANGLPTVCKGLTRHVTKTPIIVGEYWSPEKCEREERIAVVDVQHELLGCFQIAPPQRVFDAATSHAWNNGAPATCGSAAMKAWNRGDWSLGCRRLQLSDEGTPVWSYVKDGKGGYTFVRGLANRRGAERAYCDGFISP
jgi:lysozyme